MKQHAFSVTPKKVLVLSILLLSAGMFSACSSQSPSTPPANTNSLEQKTGTTTLTGTLTGSGSTATLQAGGKNVGLESYEVDFTSYNGQMVTVTGQYSGDTLFVTTIETQ